MSMINHGNNRLIYVKVNSRSRFHSGNCDGSYSEKKNVVESTLGKESRREGHIMVRENIRKNKRLTAEDRKDIEKCLSKRMTFKGNRWAKR